MVEKPIVGALVSDLHCGSKWGLWPDGMQMVGGQPWTLNPGQKYLLECWEDFLSWVPRRLDFLILCGDLNDGRSPKDEGRYQVSTHLTDQSNAAVALLKPLAERADVRYSVMGSGYHQDSETCEVIAEKLGCELHPVGLYAPPHWTIRTRGIHIETWHKLSDAQIYPATAMQREMMFSRIRTEAKGYHCDLIVVGHWHNHRGYNETDGAVLTVPCWELQQMFALRKPNRWMPDIGGLVVELYPERRNKGEKIVEFRHKVYELPEREGSELVIEGEGRKRRATAANVQLGRIGEGN